MMVPQPDTVSTDATAVTMTAARRTRLVLLHSPMPHDATRVSGMRRPFRKGRWPVKPGKSATGRSGRGVTAGAVASSAVLDQGKRGRDVPPAKITYHRLRAVSGLPLLDAGHPAPPDRLIARFWDDRMPPAARKTPRAPPPRPRTTLRKNAPEALADQRRQPLTDPYAIRPADSILLDPATGRAA
ncbi:hypothetical protein GCM10023096_01690 [Nonomuraea ferruginea]